MFVLTIEVYLLIKLQHVRMVISNLLPVVGDDCHEYIIVSIFRL